MVKSCYFLASDKRLSRSCQFCFCWGRLDWGRTWVGRMGRDGRMGVPEPQTHTAPQSKLTIWRRSCLTLSRERETVTGRLRLERESRKGGSALIKELKQLDKNHPLLDVLRKNSRYRSCRRRYLQMLLREDQMSSARLEGNKWPRFIQRRWQPPAPAPCC